MRGETGCRQCLERSRGYRWNGHHRQLRYLGPWGIHVHLLYFANFPSIGTRDSKSTPNSHFPVLSPSTLEPNNLNRVENRERMPGLICLSCDGRPRPRLESVGAKPAVGRPRANPQIRVRRQDFPQCCNVGESVLGTGKTLRVVLHKVRGLVTSH